MIPSFIEIKNVEITIVILRANGLLIKILVKKSKGMIVVMVSIIGFE